eukprot:GHVS01073301.1.p1 GENE.GHVS01073301.1~~GHVS01073301.1.p1  ORF type:complete len:648 (+),score=96.01 GHVS01073301.1:127-2070(+)
MRGRGAYYKDMYGGGSRGGGHFSRGGGGFPSDISKPTVAAHKSPKGNFPLPRQMGGDLRSALMRIDGKPYPAYRDLLGEWKLNDFFVCIDKVQADPFASPSHLRIRLPQTTAQFPCELYRADIRNIALCDYLLRQLCHHINTTGLDTATAGGGWSGSKGGDIRVDVPGQNVLKRTAVVVTDEMVEARLTLALPAHGRTIEGRRACELVCDRLPAVVQRALCYSSLVEAHVRSHVLSVEDQEALRDKLDSLGLISFVMDGAILPRSTGVSDVPMSIQQEPNLVRFQSPDDLRVSIDLPNRGSVSGMGITKGITLIVGGGFHGKSTMLEAIQLGVYNKLPGDGREFVSTVDTAVKIRAEDGRSVTSVDISAFINNLPFGKQTTAFSSEDASGSTSQAANIMEAVELGGTALLIDEDTCATNFMIRDSRMQALVARDKEPITAFIYKVIPLFSDIGVSTVMVIGGSGDFFDVADRVVQMDKYTCKNVTSEAQTVVQKYKDLLPDELQTRPEAYSEPFGKVRHRLPMLDTLLPNDKVSTKSTSNISYGRSEIDLSGVEQIVETSQTRAIADFLQMVADDNQGIDGNMSLRDVLKFVMDKIFNEKNKSVGYNGLDCLARWDHPTGAYALPRIFEMGAAINRLRTLRIRRIVG